MKKIIALLLALVMVFALVACGNNEKPNTPDTPSTPGTSTPSTPAPGTDAPPATDDPAPAPAGTVQGIDDTTIWIGNTAATTGAFAAVGVPFNAGLEAVLLAYNTAGGFNGLQVQLKHYDDGFDAAQGMTYTKTLVEDDKVFALVGHFGTNTVAATMDYVKSVGIPAPYIVTGISELYAEGATGKDGCYFPVQPIFNGEGRMLLARAIASTENGVGLGGTKVGVIATTDDAGAGILAGVLRQAEETDVPVIVQEVDAAATDYTAAVSVLKNQGCDVVIAAMNQAPLATVMNSMRDVNYNADVITSYVSASVVTLGALVDAGSITADRRVYTTAWLDTSTEAGMNDYLEFAGVMMAWEAANGIDSTDPTKTYVLNSYAMAGYVAGMTFLHGLNQVQAQGLDLTWENYIAAMESAPMHVPMGGEIDFAGGDRLGITALALNTISLEPSPDTGYYALEVVSPIMSMDDVWAAQ